MEYIYYAIAVIFGWFILSVLLRRARIWQRQLILKRLKLDLGKSFTEREVFGDELKPHL